MPPKNPCDPIVCISSRDVPAPPTKSSEARPKHPNDSAQPQNGDVQPPDNGPRTNLSDLPSGTPLISVSTDADGNMIKTTMFRYVDENGQTVVEKTIERLPDEDDESMDEEN